MEGVGFTEMVKHSLLQLVMVLFIPVYVRITLNISVAKNVKYSNHFLLFCENIFFCT